MIEIAENVAFPSLQHSVLMGELYFLEVELKRLLYEDNDNKADLIQKVKDDIYDLKRLLEQQRCFAREDASVLEVTHTQQNRFERVK